MYVLLSRSRGRRVRGGGVGAGALRGDLNPNIGKSYPVCVLQGEALTDPAKVSSWVGATCTQRANGARAWYICVRETTGSGAPAYSGRS